MLPSSLTRARVFIPPRTEGYQAVWASARNLNQIVVAACQQVGLPVLSFPPSASVVTNNHAYPRLGAEPIKCALAAGLIPLVYGDVVTDLAIGGTILSTEDLFFHLALTLKPARILLAGEEEAVFADFPQNQQPLSFISKDAEKAGYLQGSAGMDVTGGMLSKVKPCKSCAGSCPACRAVIFSGRNPRNLKGFMDSKPIGTLIS